MTGGLIRAVSVKPWLCLQRFNSSAKARLVPGGLVFLNDAVRNGAVDDR